MGTGREVTWSSGETPVGSASNAYEMALSDKDPQNVMNVSAASDVQYCVSAGGVENIYSGGAAHYTAIGRGGAANVYSCCAAVTFSVQSGRVNIFSGGLASGGSVMQDGVVSVGGRTENDAIFAGGAEEILYGSLEKGANVYITAVLSVGSGGWRRRRIESGTLSVASGGVASATGSVIGYWTSAPAVWRTRWRSVKAALSRFPPAVWRSIWLCPAGGS